MTLVDAPMTTEGCNHTTVSHDKIMLLYRVINPMLPCLCPSNPIFSFVSKIDLCDDSPHPQLPHNLLDDTLLLILSKYSWLA